MTLRSAFPSPRTWTSTRNAFTSRTSVEQARARTYLDLLSVDEITRRADVDYAEEYVEVDNGEYYNTPHECPVCGTTALIETALDSYVGEYAAGTCIACSYVKSADIADQEGLGEKISRAVEDPNS
jgi:hypothetical protein